MVTKMSETEDKIYYLKYVVDQKKKGKQRQSKLKLS